MDYLGVLLVLYGIIERLFRDNGREWKLLFRV